MGSECKWPVVGEMDVMETVNGHTTDPADYQVRTAWHISFHVFCVSGKPLLR